MTESIRISNIISRITMNCLGMAFSVSANRDQIHVSDRIYLQVKYMSPCTKTGSVEVWSGRKWYLSQYMTDDEIVKTAYCAFKAAVEHEIMEGFKVDGIILFNPHVNFEELLKISHNEVKRESWEKV